ncbi:MAG: hypothetical protein A2161_19940 [Candidatus Schekmanbacteria bacterium RBG_13_48_7]|uniref:Uncharacterized protein n=1 Tax=Candidatus Schekmanbacteria bacterium RBG_13_48_7 TaxID=1817878 RepID=A0A1F7S1F1_9BACT|nr:MAG: hypothetical protein A2161_19940 [Candidatus Schekmanbacteria bacterium RBG_13_48_7]
MLKKGDRGAPACNGCHGNHGALPPGVASLSHVCGVCHVNNSELFDKSPHKTAFDRLRIPQCEICHSNHDIVAATDSMLGIQKESVCIKCHTEEKLPAGYTAAKKLSESIETLNFKLEETKTLIEDAEQKGMEFSDQKD